MSVELHYECTRVPVTASASCGPLFIAAEGPFLRFYHGDGLHHLESKQLFQAQALHGIAVLGESAHHVTLAVWGGLFVRTLEVEIVERGDMSISLDSWKFSDVVRSPDWILDLSPAPHRVENGPTHLAAVTAHNALLELTVTRINSVLEISIQQLTTSTRSILYSAHLLWDSPDRILVAAGTAFGEIVYWSWSRNSLGGPETRMYRVFLGHEGSIFGVQISKRLAVEGCPQRLLASCSDDRTVRIWDVSDAFISEVEHTFDTDHESERIQHTGFTNTAFDITPSSSACLAIGWGHVSRVWGVQFLYLDRDESTTGVFLLSSGEDATSRTWHLTSDDVKSARQNMLPCKLLHLDCAAYHSGKNIWVSTIHRARHVSPQVIMGGADSKITACSMGFPIPQLARSISTSSEYDVMELASLPQTDLRTEATSRPHKSSKVAEFFRSYAFLDDSSYLLTTNSGKVYLGSITLDDTSGETKTASHVTLIDHPQDLNGYSICTGSPSLGLVFISGSRGSIYVYRRDTKLLSKLHDVHGKVGNMFVTEQYVKPPVEDPDRNSSANLSANPGPPAVVLLVTVMGRDVAQLLYIHLSISGELTVSKSVTVPPIEMGQGLTVTSMEYMSSPSQEDHLFLGFRQGPIAVYQVISGGLKESEAIQISLIRVLEHVHEKETVTAISWRPSDSDILSGHLVTTGRDGRLVIQAMDFQEFSTVTVHNLALPVGPNIEGLYFNEGYLLVYGFSSKNFILYNTNAEEEIMSVDTGGSHRSWAFQPNLSTPCGGSLVWTRASSMRICCQPKPSHQVVRRGGHGREIKAVTVSPADSDSGRRQLIATGAEDTDIKIFEYKEGDLICRRTLRRHRTGIQHLQWSDDGEYLFSSGGCEEFYIWRVRTLPPELGSIGVVCESVCKPESEHADLRLMSFDVQRQGSLYIIAMVFSDSKIKVYSYEPTMRKQWQMLVEGTYFTSCLTQCVFISPNVILTAGTDGHAVLWPMVQARPSRQEGATSIKWEQPARIHQNSSKTLATHVLDRRSTLVVSGGDDGSVSFLLILSLESTYTHPPIIVTRAHASAVTSCAIFVKQNRLFVATSGNDQWVRLWEIDSCLLNQSIGVGATCMNGDLDPIDIRRLKKIKTSVADVSSMAVLEWSLDIEAVRLLVCGVGMEVIRLDQIDRGL
ncbi:WD repeat protein-like protein [Massarina eburnea CBS 473.64]|uniref:WD repeat protein-like protein n=1 Tax=Massarina eburnea CBS 473.64 TaxID=1395130 RepID=A0A6A6SAL7_9PLEO|nr:WD repeat protein-like protein [Massarina eburnea CBS 473.64]